MPDAFRPYTPQYGPNPAAKLSWRILQSWWLLLPILGSSCIGSAGFLYVGLRARRPAWWIAGIVYMVLSWVSFLLVGASPQGQPSAVANWAIGVWLALWFAGVVHACLLNSAWLQWRAGYVPWYAEPSAPPPTWQQPAPAANFTVPPAYSNPAPPAFPGPAATAVNPGSPAPAFNPGPPVAAFGQGLPAAFGQGPQAAPFGQGPPAVPLDKGAFSQGPPAAGFDQGAPAVVDVNTVSAADLARLPGFDLDRVRRTVAERGRRAGFASVEEFASAAGLAPHEFAPLRDRLTCTPPTTHWQRPPEGRVLDV
ncbi:hypothetical protein GCM10009827_114120 [Dactylosporangium maewongense]|uniref:Helix-hairpin-helix motif-containing protein n=1 Tax=Dactylosporangium maewongense TaxID=634393 RepID=A0ABP4P3Z7_9ACTN